MCSYGMSLDLGSGHILVLFPLFSVTVSPVNVVFILPSHLK